MLKNQPTQPAPAPTTKVQPARTRPAKSQPSSVQSDQFPSDKVQSAKARSADPKPKAAAGSGARTPAGARPMDDMEQRIQQRAYELWESEGRPVGREHTHWQLAEREIVGRGANGRS